mgnify:CR=1 FL=1
MPNMDGLSLINKLKSDLKTSYIPIIGISAKASVEDQINAFNHGADAYIVKPFHPRQVISTIENLLSRQMLLKDYFCITNHDDLLYIDVRKNKMKVDNV